MKSMNNEQLTMNGEPTRCSLFIIHCSFMLIFWLGFLPVGFAQQALPPVFEIKADSGFIRLDTAHFQVLEDRSGNFTLEQVQHSSSFKSGSYSDPNRYAHVYWIRMRVRNAMRHDLNLYLCEFNASYLEMYRQDSTGRWQHQRTGDLIPKSQLPDRNGNKERNRLFFRLRPGEQTTIYQRSETAFWQQPLTYISPQLQTEENRINSVYKSIRIDDGWENFFFDGIMIGILFLAICYNLFIYFSIKDKVYLYFGICLIFFTLDRNPYRIQLAFFEEQPYLFKLLNVFFFIIFYIFFIQALRKFIQPVPALSRLNKAIIFFLSLTALANVVQFFMFTIPGFPASDLTLLIEILIRVVYIICGLGILKMIRRGSPDARFALLATTPLFTFWFATLMTQLLGRYFNLLVPNSVWGWVEYVEKFCFAWLIIFFSGALINRYSLIRKRVAQQAIEKEQFEKEREIERNRIIASQNELLEKQVKERTAQLQTSLEELKTTQNQLIQKEKLASLGELTAGIAHEIQNPLNFVNNFSEVSAELVSELEDEQQKPERDVELEKELLGDLKQNLQKINHHGSRASQIVRNMLAHSRSNTGEHQATNLNALCDEYLRLAYHGLRAKDNTFNCELITDFDPVLGLVKVVPQEIGRVLLNLFNNAFYTVQEKQKMTMDYQPKVTVRTKNLSDKVEIRVIDNGKGMTESVKDKLFQPFFTTKPTGEGTGLGLSMSYDIITKGHGGTLKVESQPGKGSEFIVILPGS
jgi:two-component system NtrC family sensor kinase